MYAAEVRDDGAGREGGDFAGLLVLLPTVAAAGWPHGARHAAIDFFDEGLLDFGTDFQDALLPAFHEFQAIHGVANLRFDHENDGIVAQSGGRCEKHEEIGKTIHGDAKIGGHALSPSGVNFHAALPHDAAANEGLRCAEAGAVDQDVDGALDAVARDDAVLADFGNPIGDKFDVRTIESGIVVVGNKTRLAAELIVRSERRAELRIFDPPSNVPESNRFRLFANGFIAKKSENAKLLPPENVLPEGPASQRHTPKTLLPLLGDRKVQARNDPGRRALEKIEFSNAGRDLRNELDGACAGADDGDVFAIEGYTVIPRRRMKRGTGKAHQAGQFRIARNVQRAHAGDKDARANAHSVSSRRTPCAFRFIPNSFLKTRVEVEIWRKPVMLHTAFEVVVNFLLARIHASPFRRRREGKRVEMGWNIAGAAGVTIVPPSAADVAALFDDEKRFHTGFEKLDAHAEAGETGANDEDVDSGDGRVGRSGGFSHARATTSLLDSAGATRARRNAMLSRSAWRASGIRCGASCQAFGTTRQILSSTKTPAARARSARRVESSRRTSSAPT